MRKTNSWNRLLSIMLCICMVLTLLPVGVFAADEEAVAVLDLTDPSNRTSYSTSQQIWEANGIKVTNSKGASTSDVAQYVPARFYKSSDVSIEYPGMTKLVIETTAEKYASAWADSYTGSDAMITVDGQSITIVFSAPTDSFSLAKLSAQTRVCSISVYTGAAEDIPPHEHSWLDATCTKPKTCSVCGATEGEAMGHDYQTVTQEKTCTADGMISYYCDYCGDGWTEVIPAGHEFENGYCEVCGAVSSAEQVISGVCGDNLIWVYSGDTKTLTISGNGEMDGWALADEPWHDYKSAITSVVIKDGVTSIGVSAFWGCEKITSVIIPGSVTSIDYFSFAGCENLTAILFEGDAPAIDHGAFQWVTATMYYPADNSTWLEMVHDYYYGNLTWDTYTDMAILEQPKDTPVIVGRPGIASVEAYGTGLIYEWWEAPIGSNTFTKSDVTGDVYSKVLTNSADERQVYCIVTDVAGNQIRSNTIIFWICPQLELNKPVNDQITVSGEWVYYSFTADKACSYRFVYGEDVRGGLYGDSELWFDSNTIWFDEGETKILAFGSNNILSFTIEATHSADDCWTEVTKESSCTEKGERTYHCNLCGYSWVEKDVPVIDHSFGENGICTACGSDIKDLLVIRMTDSCGDGWNGCALQIYEDGILVGTATTEIGSSSMWSAIYDPAKEYEFYWVEGSYSGECSFEITIAGEVVLSATGDECSIYPDGYRVYPVRQHNYEGVVTPPTCTDWGYTTYTCSICGDNFKDDYVEKLDHNYDEGVMIPPSCTELGYTTFTCTVCGISINADYVSSLPHAKEEQEGIVTAPTCSTQGYTTYICTVCGKSFKDNYHKLPHTKGEGILTEPTCGTLGYTTYTCTVCNESFQDDFVQPLGHSYAEGVVVPPTCTDDGYTTYACTICGSNYIEDRVSALGHSYGEDGICLTCGFDAGNLIIIDMTDSFGDSRDGNAIHVYEDGTLIADIAIGFGVDTIWTLDYAPDKEYEIYWIKGYQPWTCTFKIQIGGNVLLTSTRDDCFGYPDGYRLYPVCEHNYEESIISVPTCTEGGQIRYTCTICGYYKDNWVESLWHTPVDGSGIVTPPTCYDWGYTTYTCSVCGETYYSDSDWIENTSHTPAEGSGVVTAPTCGAVGYTTYTCASCGEKFTGDEVSKLPHVAYDSKGFCLICDGYQPCGGSGTEDDPYTIGNAGQLYWFAEQVNDGNEYACAILTANIVVNAGVMTPNCTDVRVWRPIGYNWLIKYAGTFDGANHTISGLYYNDSEQQIVGLFGYLSEGTVKNVGVIASCFIGYESVGGVVGENRGGHIINCYNTGYVAGTLIAGGVTGGNAGGSMINCYNTGTVTGGNDSLGGVAGGGSGAIIVNCYNAGSVTGENDVGGVVGRLWNCQVTDCYNTGAVSCVSIAAVSGGIVGLSECGTITNCYNLGTIVGYDCAGGIVGIGRDTTKVVNCFNDGYVLAVNGAGGVAGYLENSTANSCYNMGAITSYEYAGGVVSNIQNGIVTYCYNTGEITGHNDTGGVVGIGYGAVESCYSVGAVNGAGENVGGIVGINDVQVNNCYYLSGSVTGGNGEDAFGEAKTADQFASGEVAYLLGEGWGQKIGFDRYPVLGGQRVYCENGAYFNEKEQAITQKGRNLSYEDLIYVIDIFDLTGVENVDLSKDAGLLIWSVDEFEALSEIAFEAEHAKPGLKPYRNTGYYYGSSEGIFTRDLYKEAYYVGYVKLADGSYVYSEPKLYSPAIYAYSMLSKSSTSAETKELCVALLNYISAAQMYFDKTTPAAYLVNADLSDEQKALNWENISFNLAPEVPADKQVERDTNVFTGTGKNLLFEEMISIVSIFKIDDSIIADAKEYGTIYWTAEQFAALNGVPSIENFGAGTKTGMSVYRGNAGQWYSQAPEIAAKNMADTQYFYLGYVIHADGSVSYSGVQSYTVEQYISNTVGKTSTSAEMRAFAQWLYFYERAAELAIG